MLTTLFKKTCCLIPAIATLTILSTSAAHAADKTLGRIAIKAATTEVNGQHFPDAELELTATDMKKQPGQFILVHNESEANFLLVVIARKAVAVSGQPASKTIDATLSVRDGGTWRPATKLHSGGKNFWSVASDSVIRQAEQWAKAHAGQYSLEIPQDKALAALPAGSPQLTPQNISGRYLYEEDRRNILDISESGTIKLLQRGKRYTGTFTLSDNTIIMSIGRGETRATLAGTTLTDPDGKRWVRQ